MDCAANKPLVAHTAIRRECASALPAAVLRHHRALLSLPEMLHEQALLGEWEAMAHNVMSARTALGQQVREACVLVCCHAMFLGIGYRV